MPPYRNFWGLKVHGCKPNSEKHEFYIPQKLRVYGSTCTMQTSGCKSTPSQYKCHSQSLSRKQIKTKLMLCKPLFIVHGRVKGFLKVILQYKNKAP